MIKPTLLLAILSAVSSAACSAEALEVALNGACEVGRFSLDASHVYCGTRLENSKYSAIDGSKIDSAPARTATITTTIESLDQKRIYQRDTIWSTSGRPDHSHLFIFEEKKSVSDDQGKTIFLDGKSILLPSPDAVASKNGLVGSCSSNWNLCEWNRETGLVSELNMPVPVTMHSQIYSNPKYVVAYGTYSDVNTPKKEWLSIYDMETENAKVVSIPSGVDVLTGWNARISATDNAETIIVAQASTFQDVINENCDPFEDRTQIFKYVIETKVKTLVTEVCGNSLDMRVNGNEINLLMLRHTDRRYPNATGTTVVTTLNL